jgi:acetoin utilization protein AcuB
MARKHVRRLPVVAPSRPEAHVIGMISASDILRAFPPGVNPFAVELPDARQAPQTVGDLMQREIETTTPATPIEEAAVVMREKKIGALPVLHHGGCLD